MDALKPASPHAQVLQHFISALREREGMSAPVVEAIAGAVVQPRVTREALLGLVKEALEVGRETATETE